MGCVQGQTTLDKAKNKKRWRSTGENTSINKGCNSILDLSQLHDTATDTDKVDCSEIIGKMPNIHVDAASTSTMLDEIKKMEERLSTKITTNKDKEITEMEERLNNNIRSTIDTSIKDAPKVMQTSICTAVQNNPVIQSHSVEIKGLREENLRLNQKVQQLTAEQGHMKKQLTKIETKSLDHSLIIRGIPEEFKETEQMICDKIHCILSMIMQGETEEEKLASAKQIVIKNCHRLGRFSRNRIHPLSVELQHKQDIEFILDNRFDLERGIYVDKEYPIDIERKRKTLLPVL